MSSLYSPALLIFSSTSFQRAHQDHQRDELMHVCPRSSLGIPSLTLCFYLLEPILTGTMALTSVLITGAPGPQGEKGSKGDKGLTGPKGEHGIKGDKGDLGLPGKGCVGCWHSW